jgi:glycosyltransferase involved in cell wall biosynthesis
MKIGFIIDRLNRPLTGVGNYVYHLTKELLKIDKDKIYLINYNIFGDPHVDNKIMIIKNYFKSFPKPYYFWNWYLNYKLNITNIGLDVIHSPESSTIYMKLRFQKKIITVHDIRQYLYPDISNSMNKYGYKIFFPKALKSTDKIITVSHHTKNDIIKHFKIPENKIKVIHLAANENYKPLNEKEIINIKQKYNLNYPFILYVGALEQHKNIPTLLKALYKLKKQGIKHKLVITGKKGWKYKSIFETMEKLNLQKDVIFTGYVPDEDLPALYNAADLFVYPSLYEGFGLPPLEAMQCGTPVITSNTSSLPEVVGDAGIMVNPYDVDELANNIYEVLTNDGLREELSKKGLERAKLFSWKKCAEEHLKVYEEVYNMK